MTNKIGTYAIFADVVRYDNELTFSARVIFCEIVALCKKHGYCYANNSYFSKKFDVSISSVSKWIHALEKRKYIHIEYVNKGYHVKSRKIYIELDICDAYKYLRKHPSTLSNDPTESCDVSLVNETKDKSNNIKNMQEMRYGEYGNLFNVYLTDQEYKQMIKNCGLKETHILINDLSYHLGSTGRKYKSHYYTLMSWYRKKASSKVKNPTKWYQNPYEDEE